MKKFLYDKDGKTLRWSVLWAIFMVYILIGLVLMKPDLGVAFGPHFWRAGLWILVCPLIGYLLFRQVKKSYDSTQNAKPVNKQLFAVAAIVMAGVFGSLSAIKNDQASGITDVLVVYANGQVVNATDADERNWYFNYFTLNSVDSAYVVQYNEEPGINRTGYVTDSTRSTKPRADEVWQRPPSKKALELKGKY